MLVSQTDKACWVSAEYHQISQTDKACWVAAEDHTHESAYAFLLPIVGVLSSTVAYEFGAVMAVFYVLNQL